jgi:hypothetical protein
MPALFARDTLRDSTTHEGDIVEEVLADSLLPISTLCKSSPAISHETEIESVVNIIKIVYIFLIAILSYYSF